MNKFMAAAALALVVAVLAPGCVYTESTKYEKTYFESVAQKVAKAEGVETPTPTPSKAQSAKEGTPAPEKKQKNGAAQAASTVAAETPVRTQPAAVITVPLLTVTAVKPAVTPAATAAAGRPKKKKFRIKELEISADSMTFNKDTSVAVFTGDVVLLAEGVKLKCDTLTSENYKDNAEAWGNVTAYYKAQKTRLKCGRIKYGNKMSRVQAYEGVVTEKYLDSGNTITMHADEADFDTEYGSIEARKIKRHVKVIYKDIVAFSERVIYNDETGMLEMSGKPVVKKSGSSFTADRIKVDTARKTMRMENGIWSRIFYGDMKKAQTEVELETDKNAAPGKNIQ